MADQKHVTHGAVKDVLGRALRDDAFSDKLFSDPKGTLESEGYRADQHAVDFFNDLKKKGFQRTAKATTAKSDHDPIEFAGDG